MNKHPGIQPNRLRNDDFRYWFQKAPKSKLHQLKVFTISTLILSLAIAHAALAGYRPPTRTSRPTGRSGNTVVRTGSCGKATQGRFTALAPMGHTGQTTTTHPTFAWYVPDTQSYPVEFRLYRYDSNGDRTKITQIQLPSTQGMNQYSLPQNQPGLTVGQSYLWQVALMCNPNDGSKDQILQTTIEVVALPAELKSALAKTSDRLQRANLFAESGFWYDALAEALAATNPKPLAIPLLQDLVKLEALETSSVAKRQHEQLKQVIEIEG